MRERWGVVEESKQPKDYVSPQERLNLDQHVDKTLSALEKPSAVLLFVVLIVLIVAGANLYETVERTSFLKGWLKEIEVHRSEEIQQCYRTLDQVINVISHKKLTHENQ